MCFVHLGSDTWEKKFHDEAGHGDSAEEFTKPLDFPSFESLWR